MTFPADEASSPPVGPTCPSFDMQVPDALVASSKDAADAAAERDARMQRLHHEAHSPRLRRARSVTA